MKSHIGPKGPGKCAAGAGKCPYGGNENHFDTIVQARSAYETRQKNNVLPKFSKTLSFEERILMRYRIKEENIPTTRNEVWKYADEMASAGFETENREDIWNSVVGIRNKDWVVGFSERQRLLAADKVKNENKKTGVIPQDKLSPRDIEIENALNKAMASATQAAQANGGTKDFHGRSVGVPIGFTIPLDGRLQYFTMEYNNRSQDFPPIYMVRGDNNGVQEFDFWEDAGFDDEDRGYCAMVKYGTEYSWRKKNLSEVYAGAEKFWKDVHQGFIKYDYDEDENGY